MKKRIQKILMGAFFTLMSWTLATAQVALTAPAIDVENGDMISVDVTVTDFIEIVSMQFTVRWDSTVLNFISVDNFGLPDLNEGNFGTNSASSGLSAVAWIDESLAGVTLTDDATLFTFNFEAIGDDNATPIAFTGDLAIIEIGNADSQILDVELNHGLINVGEVNSIAKNNTQKYFSLGQNFPNPFHTTTSIPFYLTRSDDINIEIYNCYGQVVYKENGFFAQGKHLLNIDSVVLPTTGIYTIKLFTSNFLASKQLIFLN